jgi:hypothetical protein
MNNTPLTETCTIHSTIVPNWNPAVTYSYSYKAPELESPELWDFAWIDLEGSKLVILEGKAYGTEEQAKQAATVAFCKNFIDEMDDIDLYELKLRSW